MVEVKKSNVLGSGGLYLIFGAEPGHQRVFPSHLRADAEVLYSRWFMGDLEPSLLRGLVTLKSTKEDGKTRNYNAGIIEEYSFQKSAKVFGDNGLLNGQWFANRLCAMRDGAHAELEPGICGEKEKGAFSIVLANGGYADEDKGDTIHYCGTQSKTPTPTYRTQLLLDSLRVGNPIRVLRSKSKSEFAPKEGIRFDGTYKIVSKEVLDKDTAMYRFELHREAGQDPVRYQGAGARPTSQELLQLKKINDLLK
ncbi:PUA-like domain-containing protein [Hyaloscypha finlandica]|nr:PUA-like domain-containing protein [Hyaloscypha finlandica]